MSADRIASPCRPGINGSSVERRRRLRCSNDVELRRSLILVLSRTTRSPRCIESGLNSDIMEWSNFSLFAFEYRLVVFRAAIKVIHLIVDRRRWVTDTVENSDLWDCKTWFMRRLIVRTVAVSLVGAAVPINQFDTEQKGF